MFPTNNDFESEFTFENSATPLSDEPPFHVLLLGDWSGTSEKNDLNLRRPIEIDRDNFDEMLQKLNVRLELDWDDNQNERLHLQFSEIEDFHPDNIFRQVSLFSELREIRRRLANSDTFNKAAQEVRSWFHSDEAATNDSEPPHEFNDASTQNPENLLDMILTEPRQSVFVRSQVADSTELGRFVSKIVSPHLIKIDEEEQSNLIAAVDETIAELMRAILHHPKFQDLESAWRGLYFLVRRVETDSELKMFILDISKTELTDNLKEVDNLSDSILYRQIISEAIDGRSSKSFSVLGGNFTFGVNVDDIASLMRIGKISAAANVPFISHVRPEIFGIDKISEEIDMSRLKVVEDSAESKLWKVLRDSAEARYIGLTPMKVLARMPYGKAFDFIETFSLEEFTENYEHQKFLWMNPCFVGVLLLAKSFRLYGWQMAERLQQDVENLPLCVYQEKSETRSKPCAEVLLTDGLLEKLLENGFMPLVSFRDSDKVRLWRFQPVSSSSTRLGGKWNQ